MVKNIWKNIHIYCGCHKPLTNIKMMPHEGTEGRDMFYSCPKYYPENREYGEKACGNRISITDYKKMVEHISDILEDAMQSRAQIDLTGMSWSSNGIDFTIQKHDRDYIEVAIINRRTIS
jgi:hypothetical protein